MTTWFNSRYPVRGRGGRFSSVDNTWGLLLFYSAADKHLQIA